MTSTQEDPVANSILTAVQRQLMHQQQNEDLSFLQQHYEHTLLFLQAIDWQQYWLIGLIVFHILCFVLVIFLRQKETALTYYFFILLGLAALTQPLNQAGASYWEQFSQANYFDASGLFIVSVYSFPLIFNGFFCLVFILKASFRLMVEMKRRQLKVNQKTKNKRD